MSLVGGEGARLEPPLLRVRWEVRAVSRPGGWEEDEGGEEREEPVNTKVAEVVGEERELKGVRVMVVGVEEDRGAVGGPLSTATSDIIKEEEGGGAPVQAGDDGEQRRSCTQASREDDDSCALM